jgi:hypothetical protein
MKTSTQTPNKNEILSLILADMRNRKLVMALDRVGFSTDDYNTDLSILIFSKMQIAKQYETIIYNWYEDAVYMLLNIDLNKFREHQVFLAMRLYDALEEKKKHLQMDQLMRPENRFSILHWIGWKRCDN